MSSLKKPLGVMKTYGLMIRPLLRAFPCHPTMLRESLGNTFQDPVLPPWDTVTAYAAVTMAEMVLARRTAALNHLDSVELVSGSAPINRVTGSRFEDETA